MIYRKVVIISLLYAFVGVMPAKACNLPDEIVRALENGEAKSVGKYFNSSVELILPSNQGVYGKAQAEQILKNFFEGNSPGNFKYKHLQTINKENTQFYIGQLYTGKGIYRIYVYIKDRFIHQMRVESND